MAVNHELLRCATFAAAHVKRLAMSEEDAAAAPTPADPLAAAAAAELAAVAAPPKRRSSMVEVSGSVCAEWSELVHVCSY